LEACDNEARSNAEEGGKGSTARCAMTRHLAGRYNSQQPSKVEVKFRVRQKRRGTKGELGRESAARPETMNTTSNRISIESSSRHRVRRCCRRSLN
jgi:hypothetical protein